MARGAAQRGTKSGPKQGPAKKAESKPAAKKAAPAKKDTPKKDTPKKPAGKKRAPRTTPEERAKAARRRGRVRRLKTAAVSVAAVLVAGAVATAVAGGGHLGARGTAKPRTTDRNCTLIVPASPLTAKGLATPYELTATNPAAGPCQEMNANQTAFVQGAVLDPATGKISVYDPVVTDKGTRPAAPPVVPALPAGAVVALWFGFNGTTLSLMGTGQAMSAAASAAADPVLQQADCVAGENIDGTFSPFGEVGACGARAFFKAANAAVKAGKLKVPAPGTAKDGQQCPTTRSFALVDQDQSDNVTTEYLATASGRTAQDTAANRVTLGRTSTLVNASDNGLLDLNLDPALGCQPWEAPDLADNGTPSPDLGLDELQAAAYAGKAKGGGPAALVPLNDPMTLDPRGKPSRTKTDTYRSIMDMPALPAGQTPKQYCQDLQRVQGARLREDAARLRAAPSPAPAEADSLYTFLAMRLQQSFANLKCGGFGLKNTVTTTANGQGVVVSARLARK
ncbi:MAG: hypothetical protein FWE15_09415 [Actinomycetia bacterium]|nr:hypothetical protein [Actinomycetes bacterium]